MTRRATRLGVLKRVAVVVVVACSFGRSSGEAAAEMQTYVCQVAQPVISHDERAVEMQYVIYALSLGSSIPGLALRFTCHPGPGVVHRDVSRDTVDLSEITNLNAANLMGISLQVENRPRGTWNVAVDTSRTGGGSTGGRFYVDRLRVVLNLKALSEREPNQAAPEYQSMIARFNAVVAATVDCVLDNASRSDPPIRKLDLSVIGSQRFRQYAKVYTIKAAPKRKAYRF